MSLVKDIYPGETDSSPSRLVRLGDAVYFEAFSPATGGELAHRRHDARDPARHGHRRGRLELQPTGPRGHGPVRVLHRRGPGRRAALWRTDGTAAGTVPVPGADGLDIRANLVAGERIDLFEVPDSQGFTHLWSTDGDSPATDLGRLQPVPYDSATIGADIYLGVFTQAEGSGLLRTDGTTAGTSVVSGGLHSEGALGAPSALNELGVVVYFYVPSLHGPELWRSDGTDAGTSRVASFPDAVDGGWQRAAIWSSR